MPLRLRHPIRVAALWMVACASPLDLRAEVISLWPSKDNTLYENPSGVLSNGQGYYLFAGVTANYAIRRGLVAFDVADHIPAGSTITSASLTMFMSRTIAAAEIVELHRVLSDWGEGTSAAPGEEGGGGPAMPGDATWIHTFHNTGFWAAPGGDFVPQSSASAVVIAEGFYIWDSTPQLVADVQFWLDNPASEYGWLLRGNELVNTTAKRFDSRQNPDPTHWPVLTVTYRPIPEPATALLAVVPLAFRVVCRKKPTGKRPLSVRPV